jgi:hypothetical protein
VPTIVVDHNQTVSRADDKWMFFGADGDADEIVRVFENGTEKV